MFCVLSWSSFMLVDSFKSQIEHSVSDQSIGFSLVYICFLISFISLNLDLNMPLNHLTRVSVVNLSSMENKSDTDVIFLYLKYLLQHLLAD